MIEDRIGDRHLGLKILNYLEFPCGKESWLRRTEAQIRWMTAQYDELAVWTANNLSRRISRRCNRIDLVACIDRRHKRLIGGYSRSARGPRSGKRDPKARILLGVQRRKCQ